MTQAARMVLQDVMHAIDLHDDDLGGEAFRVSWFSITGLLRAVGHVLDKVDSHRSEALELAINHAWAELQRTKPEPVIFWGFIESERNRFLKNYEHSVNRSVDLKLYDSAGIKQNAVTSIIVSRSQGIDTRGADVDLKSTLDHGPFTGQNERQVARRAVKWWNAQLDDIDAHVRALEHA